MNLKCITPSERSQTRKATYCGCPFIQHSGKGKTIGTENRLAFAGVWASRKSLTIKGKEGNF